jgi:hypothetical protein
LGLCPLNRNGIWIHRAQRDDVFLLGKNPIRFQPGIL